MLLSWSEITNKIAPTIIKEFENVKRKDTDDEDSIDEDIYDHFQYGKIRRFEEIIKRWEKDETKLKDNVNKEIMAVTRTINNISFLLYLLVDVPLWIKEIEIINTSYFVGTSFKRMRTFQYLWWLVRALTIISYQTVEMKYVK